MRSLTYSGYGKDSLAEYIKVSKQVAICAASFTYDRRGNPIVALAH